MYTQQRRGVDFSVAHAAEQNGQLDAHTIMQRLSVPHRLALTSKPVLASVSYCSLATAACGMTPSSEGWPSFPVPTDQCSPYNCYGASTSAMFAAPSSQ